MENELRELQKYCEEVETFRMEQRKNKVPMTQDSVQSMNVSEYFEKDLKDAETLVEEEIGKQMKGMEFLGMDVTPKIEQIESKKIK